MSKFEGFPKPTENYTKIPHIVCDLLPSLATKPSSFYVLYYILRHTWGFQEFDELKKITLDEFENGRKRRDGSRMDGGCGFSKPTIVSSLQWLEHEGYIQVETDGSDAGRVKKSYSLVMLNDLTPGVKPFNTWGKVTLHRSEKETLERNKKKEKQQQPPRLDINFSTALKEYQNTFGPLGSQHLFEKFQMLWDEYPKLETHTYARKEMYRAMMREGGHVRPNLGYYAQCLATGAARAQGKREERRARATQRSGCRREVADPNDPDIKAWLEKRREHGGSD